MDQSVEISSFDLRYESYRMRHEGSERALLCSISDYGVREPLEGVDTKEGRVLLNGFKRLRCAKKLGVGIVPYICLGTDDIKLLRTSNAKTLSILEQAKIFSGTFPVYSYMYTLRQFIRMNGINRGEIDGFVNSVAGMDNPVKLDTEFAGEWTLNPVFIEHLN